MTSPSPTVKVFLKVPPKNLNDEDLRCFYCRMLSTTKAAPETNPSFPPYIIFSCVYACLAGLAGTADFYLFASSGQIAGRKSG